MSKSRTPVSLKALRRAQFRERAPQIREEFEDGATLYRLSRKYQVSADFVTKELAGQGVEVEPDRKGREEPFHVGRRYFLNGAAYRYEGKTTCQAGDLFLFRRNGWMETFTRYQMADTVVREG